MALDPSRYPETLDPARRRLLGCWYTPDRLIRHLVEAAIAPLMTAPVPIAARRPRAAPGSAVLDAALSLRILDPAVGDGSFLIEVARCMARRLAGETDLPEASLRAEIARRCLWGIDVDPAAAALARSRVRKAAGAVPAIMTADALAGTRRGAARGSTSPPGERSFDVIVGNPPWGGWNRGLDPAAKGDYRRRFALARGLLDPAMLFLERCIAWLRPGGRLALVLPEYFLTKNYPAARAHVLAHLQLEELARWGMAFPGVNVGACSLVARRRAGRGEGARPARERRAAPVRCLPRGPGGPVVLTPAAAFAREPGHVFNLELDDAGRRLLARLLREGTPLARIVEAHEGIHSGNARHRLFVPPGARPPAGVKPGALRPMVMGRAELRPFVLRPAGWRVAYDRVVVRPERGEYANLGKPQWYRPPKLLVRRTGDRIVAAVDRAGVMASNNVFVARVRARTGVTPDLLAACLNAPLATWCFRAMVPRAGSVFAELKLAHLGRLPVPPFALGDAGRKPSARLTVLARRLGDPALPDGAPDRASAVAEIDRIVCDLFGLSAPERDRIHRDTAAAGPRPKSGPDGPAPL